MRQPWRAGPGIRCTAKTPSSTRLLPWFPKFLHLPESIILRKGKLRESIQVGTSTIGVFWLCCNCRLQLVAARSCDVFPATSLLSFLMLCWQILNFVSTHITNQSKKIEVTSWNLSIPKQYGSPDVSIPCIVNQSNQPKHSNYGPLLSSPPVSCWPLPAEPFDDSNTHITYHVNYT